MTIEDAIDTVIAYEYLEGGYPGLNNRQVINKIRADIDHEEIDSWVEADTLDDEYIELAYRMVIDASEAVIENTEI